MNRAIRTLTIVSIFLAPGIAVSAQVHSEWVRYNSAEGGYSVLLPTEPKLSSQETTASTGEKIPQYLASSQLPNAIFIAAYMDYRNDMTFSLEKARDGMLEATKGSLLSENAISLGDYAGKELRVLAKAQGTEFIVRARIYHVARRVYVLQAIFAKSDDGPDAVEKAARFFDSFKLETGSRD